MRCVKEFRVHVYRVHVYTCCTLQSSCARWVRCSALYGTCMLQYSKVPHNRVQESVLQQSTVQCYMPYRGVEYSEVQHSAVQQSTVQCGAPKRKLPLPWSLRSNDATLHTPHPTLHTLHYTPYTPHSTSQAYTLHPTLHTLAQLISDKLQNKGLVKSRPCGRFMPVIYSRVCTVSNIFLVPYVKVLCLYFLRQFYVCTLCDSCKFILYMTVLCFYFMRLFLILDFMQMFYICTLCDSFIFVLYVTV